MPEFYKFNIINRKKVTKACLLIFLKKKLCLLTILSESTNFKNFIEITHRNVLCPMWWLNRTICCLHCQHLMCVLVLDPTVPHPAVPYLWTREVAEDDSGP